MAKYQTSSIWILRILKFQICDEVASAHAWLYSCSCTCDDPLVSRSESDSIATRRRRLIPRREINSFRVRDYCLIGVGERTG
jgi:hypothetical protein